MKVITMKFSRRIIALHSYIAYALILASIALSYSDAAGQDSLLQRLKIIEDGDEKLSILQSVVGANFFNNTDLADSCVNVMLALSKSISSDSIICTNINAKATVKLVKAEYDSVFYYTQMALDIIGEKYPILQAKLLHVTALTYYYQGNYEKSLDKNFESLKIREELNLPKLQILSLSNIAIAYERMHDPDNAIHYNEKALSLTPDEDKYSIATIENNMAAIYIDQEKFKKAIEVLTSANQTAISLNKKVLLVDTHIGLAKSYSGLDNNQQATYHAEKALSNSKALNNKSKQITSLNIIGGLKMKKGEFKKAISNFNNALKISLDNNIGENRLEVYQNLRDAYAGSRNFTDYTRMKDSIASLEEKQYTAEKIKITKELTYKYETAKKDLLIKDNLIKIEKQNNQKNLLLLSAAFLLLLCGGIYAFMRNRLRSNKKIAIQQTEIKNQRIEQLEQENKILSMSSMIEGQESERKRIAQDLHDSLGGLLATIKVKFGIIQKEIEELESMDVYKQTSNLIDDACAEVRKIAHNMMPDALNKLGLIAAVKDIADQYSNIKIKVIDLGIGRLSENQEIMLYRVIQEFLNNTRKHADASEVIIQFSADDIYDHIYIEDNGSGFDKEKTIRHKGLGLKSMESRISFIGGEMEIDSKIGVGTTLQISIPKE